MKNILTFCILCLFNLKIFGLDVDTNSNKDLNKKYNFYVSSGLFNNYNHQIDKIGYLTKPGFTFTTNIGTFRRINKHLQVGLGFVYNFTKCELNSGVHYGYYHTPSYDTVLYQSVQSIMGTKSNKLGLSFDIRYSLRKVYFGFGLNYMPFVQNVTVIHRNYYSLNVEQKELLKSMWVRDYYYNKQYKLSVGYKLKSNFFIEGSYLIASVSESVSTNFYDSTNPFWSKYFQHFGLVINYLISSNEKN